jgi:hypothetical protein
MSVAILTSVNVHVEAKRVEAINLYAAIEQARQDASGKIPLVWHRRNAKPSVVIVETTNLVQLAREIMRIAPDDAKCEKP